MAPACPPPLCSGRFVEVVVLAGRYSSPFSFSISFSFLTKRMECLPLPSAWKLVQGAGGVVCAGTEAPLLSATPRSRWEPPRPTKTSAMIVSAGRLTHACRQFFFFFTTAHAARTAPMLLLHASPANEYHVSNRERERAQPLRLYLYYRGGEAFVCGYGAA